jgi:hypothetical protein
MGKKISILLFLLLSGLLKELIAQPKMLYFRFSGGATSAFRLQEIRKMSFENDFVKLQLLNGTSYSWAASSIDYYSYTPDLLTSSEKAISEPNSWEVKLIPNPTAGKQTLKFFLPSGGDVWLVVFNAAGKQVWERQYDKLPAGEQELSLDWPSALPGNYVLSLKTRDFTTSQTIIRR